MKMFMIQENYIDVKNPAENIDFWQRERKREREREKEREQNEKVLQGLSEITQTNTT